MKSIEQADDLMIIEYLDEKVEFTRLSESVFESESGVRYEFEENITVADHEESLAGD